MWKPGLVKYEEPQLFSLTKEDLNKHTRSALQSGKSQEHIAQPQG